MGRTQVSYPKHTSNSENGVGDHGCAGCFEVQSCGGGKSSSDLVTGPDRSVGGGPRSAYSSLRRFVGGCSAILFLREACPAGHIREPAHEVVASYVGRSIHVEDQGAGRFCGKKAEVRKEESMGEAGCESHWSTKGRSKEKACQRRRKRREESGCNGGGRKQPPLQTSDA